MKATLVLATALVLAATTGGCASWDGEKYGEGTPPTDPARAQCESAVATLKDQPDYDTALRACLDEKSRRAK
jgi:hypothetical protein